MPFDLPETLQPFLLPLLIAVPLAVVVWIITTRRGDQADVGVPPSAAERSQAPTPTPTPTPAPASPAAPVDLALVPRPPALPLLVVDDSAVVRAKLGKLFKEAGHEVVLARDGVEALEQLGQARFGVLVTDLEMPNMDGFALIQAVQGSLETEDLPIIAISGHEELHARLHQVQGLYGMFPKPWNDRELLKRVETLAQLRPAARP